MSTDRAEPTTGPQESHGVTVDRAVLPFLGHWTAAGCLTWCLLLGLFRLGFKLLGRLGGLDVGV